MAVVEFSGCDATSAVQLLPGYCILNFDTWKACEAAVGVSIDNPLETYDWHGGYIKR